MADCFVANEHLTVTENSENPDTKMSQATALARGRIQDRFNNLGLSTPPG